MRTSPVWFVIRHVDDCPRCSLADFCETGLRLMRLAQDVLRDEIPPIPKPLAKA